MKKIWENPLLDSLDITATAGGPIDPTIIDGPQYFDPDKGVFKTPRGEDYPDISE